LRRFVAKQPDSGKPWDIAFYDPPYATDYLPVLETFGVQSSALLSRTALLIVEHHHKNQLPEALTNLQRARVLKQGDSALSFYEASVAGGETQNGSAI
jgi:16S rRNA G966 N2-methylase RsmD